MCVCTHETVSHWYVRARAHPPVFDRTTVVIAHFMSIFDLHLCRANWFHLYFFFKYQEKIATYPRVHAVGTYLPLDFVSGALPVHYILHAFLDEYR